ncbi:S-layer homology domain-containing protein [Neofamilia massiliensis]|uniref:S-layer homology domain-containing protein n=1 Tax=Neofamilia massiliensis TaxID=1673724 RepID=UPI0006BB8BF6|nr:S-layer homology domain-containing protein [Neofamilia massiliensis]
MSKLIKKEVKIMSAIIFALLMVFTSSLINVFAMDKTLKNVELDYFANTIIDLDNSELPAENNNIDIENNSIIPVENSLLEVNLTKKPISLRSGNPLEEKAITLIKEREAIGDYDTLNQAINKMYELTNGGSKFNFIVQVNKDIDLSEYTQFGFPYGTATLTSKDPASPRTIKAKNLVNDRVFDVVNGAHLTVENIIIDGNKEKRLLWVDGSEKNPTDLTINKGTVLQNGKGDNGGAIFCQDVGNVTINGGEIRNNEATGNGGAICYIGKGTLTINGGEIYGNKVPSGNGGAIVLQGKGLINGGKIYENVARNGGGISTGNNANLDITGGEIYGNSASYAGGGVYCGGNSKVKLSGGQVSKNTGKYGGGVTAVYNSEFIMEGNSVISENEAERGGGIYAWGSKYGQPTCNLKSGTIEKNGAPYGGGIFLQSQNATISGVVIQENVANFGGGIYSSLPAGETLTVDGAKLYKNEARSGGGVCLTKKGGSLNFKNAEFKENKAYYGGGIWTSNTMTIENTTFTGNEAMKSDEPGDAEGNPQNLGHGGAIYVNTRLADDGVVTVDGCTFTNNKADKSGGAISVDETHGLLKVINNTVFDGNQATGELGHGGAIYSNLHAYMPEYDDGSTGGLVQPPTAKDYYYNINTDATTVFKNNKAFKTFTPPSTKDEFVKLLYKSTSHPGTKYDHPLNNDDVNLIVFKEVIFDKNYDTENPIHDAFLLLEKSKLEDFPVDPVRDGYIFKGWNTQKDGKGTEFKPGTVIENDITVYAQWEEEKKPKPQPEPKPEPQPQENYINYDFIFSPVLNLEDHYQYLIGYEDQSFRPENNMTREEVAVMFSRLLKNRPIKGKVYSYDYSDVENDRWSITAISYMNELGIIKGYPDGTFKPTRSISRAEFAAIATRFSKITGGNKIFSDLSKDHWAYDLIQKAATAGWISGYPDGTFKPDREITRAEVVTITNRMLNRYADENYVDRNLYKIIHYTDMDKSHWAYYPVIEASNGHKFERKANGKDEKWTEVNDRTFVYDK